MPVVHETVAVVLRLAAFAREEDGVWLAGCRSLDVFSQGASAEEAKANLREAVELWMESCIERDTLAAALRELGWSPVRPETVSEEEAPRDERDSFPLEISVPAYQAALFSEATGAAC